eukprot:233870-Chlamydomonas_euryale.AAC.2
MPAGPFATTGGAVRENHRRASARNERAWEEELPSQTMPFLGAGRGCHVRRSRPGPAPLQAEHRPALRARTQASPRSVRGARMQRGRPGLAATLALRIAPVLGGGDGRGLAAGVRALRAARPA